MISNPTTATTSSDPIHISSSSVSDKGLANVERSGSSTGRESFITDVSELDLDEYSSKATRTLYIGNLDRDVKYSDIREKLDKKYGDIIEIEIKKDNKKPLSSVNSYAFIQFSDIKSVVKAIRGMNGKTIGKNEIKIGFGKTKPARTLWLDNISDQLKEAHLYEYFKPYCESNIEQILIDRNKCQALIYFAYINDAKECADKIRAKKFYDKRIAVDFASKEFISSRFEHLVESSKTNSVSSSQNRAGSFSTNFSTIPSSQAIQQSENYKDRTSHHYSKSKTRYSGSPNETRSSRSCSADSESRKKDSYREKKTEYDKTKISKIRNDSEDQSKGNFSRSKKEHVN